MAGTIVVDTIQSDSSYASKINVTSNVAFTSPVNFTGGIQLGGQDVTFGGMRNRLINGDMRIDQRNVGANVAIASAYTVDRWKFDRVATGGSQIYYGQQVAEAPTGFTHSYKIKVTTGGAVGNDDYTQFNQYVEGNNLADMAFGTASAKTFTVSFWVKSSLATTYSIALRSGGFDRTYVATYTVNAADTWEYKTITVPGCTDGTWYTSNSYGIDLHFCFGCGSTYGTTSLNTWLTGSKIGYTHSGMLATTGATAQITGVQLEKGSSASNFEYRPYGTELALCQRYYVDLANNGGSTQNSYRCVGFASTYTTTQGSYVIQVPVPMRTLPSLTQAGTMYLQNLGTTSVSSFAGPYSMAGTIIEGDFTMVSTVTANITAVLRWNNSATQKFAYSAEL